MFTGSSWLSMCGVVFAFQIDIALDPGAEVMRVERNIVFYLAGLDTAQAADALPGIDAERPLVLGPVVAGDCRWRAVAVASWVAAVACEDTEFAATAATPLAIALPRQPRNSRRSFSWCSSFRLSSIAALLAKSLLAVPYLQVAGA